MTKISVFLIDDHNLFSQGVASLLEDESQIKWLGHANHPDLGKEQVDNFQPDIVMLDYFLPSKNGIDLGKEIQELSPASKLVLLTMENSFLVIEMAKKAGFSGFIPKSAERKVLVKTLLQISKGEKVFPQSHKSDQSESPELAKFNQLSKREKEIAFLVAQGQTSGEIAEKLFLSLLTVNTHRRNLFQKLGFKNVVQLSAFIGKLKGV